MKEGVGCRAGDQTRTYDRVATQRKERELLTEGLEKDMAGRVEGTVVRGRITKGGDEETGWHSIHMYL